MRVGERLVTEMEKAGGHLEVEIALEEEIQTNKKAHHLSPGLTTCFLFSFRTYIVEEGIDLPRSPTSTHMLWLLPHIDGWTDR